MTELMSAMEDHRPRVAVVSDYSLDTLGGAENAYFEQVLALADVTDVLAVTPPSERLTELGKQTRVETYPVPVWCVVPGLGFPVAANTARLRAQLRAAFIDAKIDVVHVHSEFGVAAAAIAAAKELRIPVVHTVHTFFWQAPPTVQALLHHGGPRFYRAMTGFALSRETLSDSRGDSMLRNMTLSTSRLADSVVSPSAHQARILRRAGLRNVNVIPNTVRWNSTASAIATFKGPLRVLWMGRFSEEKRILPFLRSALAAMQQVGSSRLQIDVLGDGPQFRKAVRAVSGQKGIRLHGRISSEDIPSWLANCHVTALSSIGWDNQPMTVAESIMALRGVIWTDHNLTEGLTRAGIPAFGEDEVLTHRLVELARDPAAVVTASQSAREVRPMFGAMNFIESISAVYHQVLSTGSVQRERYAQ